MYSDLVVMEEKQHGGQAKAVLQEDQPEKAGGQASADLQGDQPDKDGGQAISSVIKTPIYCNASSATLSEEGMRQLADLVRDEHPEQSPKSTKVSR